MKKTLIVLTVSVLFCASTLRAQWTTSNLPHPRSQMAAASVGGKVFFAGGSSYPLTSNVVDIYDNSSKTWSTAALSQARSNLAATQVGSKILFAGGYTGTGTPASNVVDIYDNYTNTWTTATLSQARYDLAATSVGNKVFFGGGNFYSDDFFSYEPSSVVDIYDNSTGTWSTAALSEGRNKLTATSVGSKVFFGGGNSFNGAIDVVDIYDNSNDTWTTATLSQARYNLAATSVGSKVFFGGGSFYTDDLGDYVSNVVDIYDNSTDTWSTATLSQIRTYLGAASVGDKVFFAGGISIQNNNTVISNVVDIYDNNTNTWTTASLSQAGPESAASVGDKVFFTGGDVVDIYTPPAPVYVTTPANGAINTNISLTLTSAALTGATKYTIDLSPDNTFQTGVITKSGARMQSFSGLSYGTTYYARVKTNLSPVYGIVTSFTTGSSEYFAYLSSPANSAGNQNINLNAVSTMVTGASSYTIDLSTDNFATVAFTNTGSRSQPFSGLAYGTKYYARVKTNLSANYGKITTFTTASPYLTSPSNGATGTGIALTITSATVPGATTYTIDLSTDNFATVAFTNTGSRSLPFSGLAYGTKYYARVMTDLSASYGKITTFTTASPYVTSPSNGAGNTAIALTITSATVPGATTYTIDLSTDNFATVAFTQSGSRSLPFSGLAYGTKYYTRVKTDLNFGKKITTSSIYGKITTFTTSSPYVTSPANGAINIGLAPTIASATVPSAATYTIELSTNNFATIAFTQSGSHSLPFTGLAYGTKYYTRVKTDLSENYGKTTSFTTSTVASLCYITSPANAATNVPSETDVVANLVVGASSYTIELSTDPMFKSGITENSSSNTISFSLSDNTKYYARVYTNLNPNKWGAIKSFTTGAPLSPPASPGGDPKARVGSTKEEVAVEFDSGKAVFYPIPFRDKLNIHVQSDRQEEMAIQLYDVNGMVAGQFKGMTNHDIELTSDNLSSGMYIIKIVMGKEILVKKIIKE